MTQAPIEVFISFSHQDNDLQKEFVVHLSLLKRQQKIADWYDFKVKPGNEWDAEIKAKLESAQIILMLISPPFMASDYCYDIEMTRALERHEEGTACVIPIILRPCDWKDSPFNKLKALPEDGNPITLWDDRDSAFLDVVQGIRRVVDSFAERNSKLRQNFQANGHAVVQGISSSDLFQTDSPFVTGTPILQPRHFFGRKRVVKRLFNLLKTHPLQNAAIIGQRRSGKTSLLNYLRTITTTPSDQLRLGQQSDWLPNPENYRWIFVDFQDVRMAQRERLLKYLLEEMQLPVPYPCDLDRFMDRVSGNLLKPTVILMDEIGVGLQRCPELDDGFWESLRSLASNQTDGNLAFVLATPENPVDLARHTGHSSPFFNIFGYTTTLKALTEPEARELITKSPIPFSEADTAWILEQSGGWPILLQILCRERLFSLEEGDMSDDWQDEGLEQIQPFRYLLTEE